MLHLEAVAQNDSLRAPRTDSLWVGGMRTPEARLAVKKPQASQQKNSKAISKDDILAALRAERQLVARGVTYVVKAVEREADVLRIELASARRHRSGAIDESLEEARCKWTTDYEPYEARGFVSFVNPEEGSVVVERRWGDPPVAGQEIKFFLQDFLEPLIDVWETSSGLRTAREVLKRTAEKPLDEPLQLPEEFSPLREKQAEAIDAALYPLALVDGPPGTGKTFTLGAMVANFLARFPERKVLIVGPTNIAVDAAITSVDDWLKRLGKEDVAKSLKRLGSRFDVKNYTYRQYLLEPGIYEQAIRVQMAELEEPDRKNAFKYAMWKRKVRELRQELGRELKYAIFRYRVIAMTTATALGFHKYLKQRDWDLVVTDEASQIPFPAALVLGGLAPRCVFAGDPRQLAPVVQEKSAQRVLEKTAFDVLRKRARSVFLDEQSRMCQDIGEAVSELFYEKKLRLCAKARNDTEWRKSREPYFIQGRSVPHVVLKRLEAEYTWSKTYNGPIRFNSAVFITELIDELRGAYANEDDIVVLTPYRAQRALISEMLRKRNVRIKVSTVHRAQGSERKIVIFDPVSAHESFLNSPGGFRLLNVAFSRAQAHLIVPISQTDLFNPKIRELDQIVSRQLAGKTRFDFPPLLQ